MSRMTRWRHRDEDVLIEALRKRVHPNPARTCWCCGFVVEVPAESATVIRTGLDGADLEYGICGSCGALADELDRVVTAQVLGIALDAVDVPMTVARYADVPGARPSLPNARPWAHLDRTAVATALVDGRAKLHVRINPITCSVCGTNERFEDRGYTSGRCPSCDVRLFSGPEGYGVARPGAHPDWRRDEIASVLVGVPCRDRLGQELGVRFWSELDEDERAALPVLRGPWAHHARDIARWRREQGQPIVRPTW